MMYGKTRPRVSMQRGDLKLQRNVLILVCIVLVIAVAALTYVVVRNSVYRRNAQLQFHQRMISSAATAVDEVNRLNGSTTSSTAAQLARVRQQVYYMEQLNQISIALSGEGSRLVPAEQFEALDKDLDEFEALAQRSTISTLDTRASLLEHLAAVQSVLEQR
ncbi:MAG: hypothetical protein K5919_04530 [Clostridiales bacterium]|nr:hypothetical protein [Clostridiales bacterium]